MVSTRFSHTTDRSREFNSLSAGWYLNLSKNHVEDSPRVSTALIGLSWMQGFSSRISHYKKFIHNSFSSKVYPLKISQKKKKVSLLPLSKSLNRFGLLYRQPPRPYRRLPELLVFLNPLLLSASFVLSVPFHSLVRVELL